MLARRALLSVLMIGLLMTTSSTAQTDRPPAGTSVEALVPAVIDFHGGDIVLITGHAKGYVEDLPQCGFFGNAYVQSGIIINPGNQQFPTRLADAIFVLRVGSDNTPLPPGTRLSGPIQTNTCTVGDVSYIRYQFTVE